MITVRVPEEVRKYKEKILFGLTARQLIASLIAVIICVPLYLFGKDYISGDILEWIIIFVALPLGAIGFVKVNGLPAEKYFLALFKQEFLYPRKRVYKTECAFRTWQNAALAGERPRGFWQSLQEESRAYQASLERAVLIEEAAARGEEGYDVKGAELITVKKRGGNGKMPKKDNKKKNTKKEKAAKKSRLQIVAEEVEEQLREDPHYIPTKRENEARRRWKLELERRRKKEVVQKKAVVEKENSKMKKRRTATTTIPKSTQQTIPYIADYDEGLFEIKPNKYSKVYVVQDINYKTAKESEQIEIFCKLGEFLNYFSEDINFAWCIDNRPVSKQEQERQVLYQMTGDELDVHRVEFNSILRRQIVAGRNDMSVEKFLTVTIDAASPIEALLRFHKIDAEVIKNLRNIGGNGAVMSTEDRLAYYHDRFRKGHEGEFNVDFEFLKMQGLSSKDYIAPSYIEVNAKHIRIGDTFCRVMYLCNLPASFSDELMYDLCDNSFPITTSIGIQPVAQDKALRTIRKQLSGIEKDKIEAEKKAIRGGYDPSTIRHDIKDSLQQVETLYDDMLNKNQKLFYVTVTCMVQGDTLDELEENCAVVESKVRAKMAQLKTLTQQQEEGFKITLPFGYAPKEVCVERALTTDSTAIFMPFSSQELFQRGGYYYGLNQISHNLVVVDRLRMKTPSGFVLGSSGSGKSFFVKKEIASVVLHDNQTNILIIDPENEYGEFCRVFGGTVLKISADSDCHINPMDMTENYGLDEDDGDDTPLSVKKEKAVKKKSDYIMSIVERMISVGGSSNTTALLPTQKTIVDRCVQRCYKTFLDHDFDPAYTPTLLDLQDELDKEKGTEEGRMLAEGVAYYTRGSMDVFAHKTNVDINNRLVVFNVRGLGEQLKQVALIIVFDFIWNRMVENKNRGIRTYCYCDEIHVMFQSYYSAENLKQLYKRGRKYGLVILGITQNCTELLKSEQAKSMIGNSDFIVMLNQKSEDLKVLAEMLSISEMQMGYVSGVEAGSGLIFAENVIVPFADRFPTDSYLYRLMSTKFGEDMSNAEIQKAVAEIMQSA